jgi:two-component system, OmpR family, sensor kinase
VSGPRKRPASLGLRWRLAGWVALVTLACTGIAFVAVYRGTGAELRHQMDHELAGDSGELAHSLARAHSHSPALLAASAGRYVADQPFGASSTLLFAVVPGLGPISNRPELFDHGPPDEGETAAAQAQENRLSTQLLTVHSGYSTLTLPDVGNLRLLKRVTRPAGPSGPRVTVGVGEPLAPVARAQRGVARAFILAGILALAGALIASYLIGTRVSRPLRRMAAVAARVDAGDLHPRIDDPGGQGDEVRVLAESFNHMLDRLTDAFAGQRAFIADASHELRTPLTVVRGQLELLASQEQPSAQEVRRVERLLQAEVARISRLVDDLLLLAKTEQSEFLRIQAIDLSTYVRELWDGVSLLAPRRFQLGPIPEGTLQADPDRLTQALRNLVSNAIEHTSAQGGLVSMSMEAAAGERIRFVIEDNGPGIPADQLERVFDRFHRTDAARDRASGGTGLGLSIVRAIAEAHGGRVAARSARAGGACIEFELPGFAPYGTITAAPVNRPARRSASASPASSRLY